MSQATFGQALGRSDQSVAVWEKQGRIPKFADTMVRVIYAVHDSGNEKIKNIIHAVNDADRAVNFVMTESKGGWIAAVQDDPPPAHFLATELLVA